MKRRPNLPSSPSTMENDLYGHHHLNPNSRYSIYAPSRSLLSEPYIPPSSLLPSSSRYLSSSLADRYLPSEAASAASRPYSFLDASRPYAVPSAADLVGSKRLSEAFYEQSVIGNRTINGQSEDWLSTNLLAKRPRTEPTRNLPVYPQRPGEKDCAHYMLTRTCRFGDACKFDHPIWVPEGGIPDWKEAQPDLPHSHPERPGEPDCPHFLKTGICKFGFKCKFNHPKDKLVTPISSDNVDASALPERPSEPPCAYYVKTGKCKFGANCKFHHPKDVHASTVETETGNSEQHMHNTEPTASDVKLNQPPVVAPAFRYTSKGLPIRLGEEDCPFYMRTGSCKFGATCRFSHPDINPINLAAMDHSVLRSPANLGLVDPVASILQGHGPRLAQAALGPGPVIYPQRPEAIECDHYMKTGECRFGEKCKFHHPIDRYNPSSSANRAKLTLAGLPRREGSMLCAFYMKTGTCKYGPQCRFDHPPPGEVMSMAAAQETTTAPKSAEKDEKNTETAQGAEG